MVSWVRRFMLEQIQLVLSVLQFATVWMNLVVSLMVVQQSTRNPSLIIVLFVDRAPRFSNIKDSHFSRNWRQFCNQVALFLSCSNWSLQELLYFSITIHNKLSSEMIWRCSASEIRLKDRLGFLSARARLAFASHDLYQNYLTEVRHEITRDNLILSNYIERTRFLPIKHNFRFTLTVCLCQPASQFKLI